MVVADVDDALPAVPMARPGAPCLDESAEQRAGRRQPQGIDPHRGALRPGNRQSVIEVRTTDGIPPIMMRTV